MKRRKDKRGLRVKFCENVASYQSCENSCYVLQATAKDGWFIQAWRGGRWYSLMNLRFVREKDALRAAEMLTLAGMDSHNALSKADPMTVMEIGCGYLQW